MVVKTGFSCSRIRNISPRVNDRAGGCPIDDTWVVCCDCGVECGVECDGLVKPEDADAYDCVLDDEVVAHPDVGGG